MRELNDKTIKEIRKEFPALNQEVNGLQLTYLDSAATTQKPVKVLESIDEYYSKFNGNPHRGAHYLSVESTRLYEEARDKVRDFINAKNSREIIFTKSATEALNMLAYSYGMNFIEENDEIALSIMEHHSNLVTWQQVKNAKKAKLKFMYINSKYSIIEDEINNKINEKTKLVAITHISNALGVINPIKKIIERAHEVGAKVILDVSQSIPHMKIDVRELDADFVVFSGHKLLAPMGIGVLYGKEELLEVLPPFLFGGDMIEYVEEESATFGELPHRLEAGTQNVEGAVGLSTSIDYLNNIGWDNILEREGVLLKYARERIKELEFVETYLPNEENHSSVISFNIKGVHPHDVATIMDNQGVAIRAGHHCCQPLMKYLNLNSTCRMSLYFYNTKEDIDRFIRAIIKVKEVFNI